MRIFEVHSFCDTDAFLQVYLRDREYEFVKLDKRPLMMIFPGGGYCMTADREAEPVAMTFIKKGYQACVLRYTVRERSEEPALGDTPLREAAAAVRYAREHAEEWGIDPKKITVCGFSAGGHLAASLAVHWNNPARTANIPALCRPDTVILSYAVCLGNALSHRGSIENLTGVPADSPSDSDYDTTLYVGPDAPPAFIWHTYEDDCVPVENALAMANAYRAAGRPFALHIFTHGWHGLSVGTKEVGGAPAGISDWTGLAHTWLRSMGTGTEY